MPWRLTAEDAIRQIRDGRLTSQELVTSCNERIRESDAQVGAWAHYDPEYALAQARECDAMRQRGRPLGTLHGIPVGVKDIVDTADLPTECGSPLMAGRLPDEDATVISRLKEAGAVIIGKTVTTQLAFMPPSTTSNPHDTARTPGGSSSGSAAAVAAGHVPLAVGSQTNGSVIRPASFCGIFGFKPTRGMISRYGVLQTSASLDQMGVFGRSMEDVARLADALTGFDGRDTGTYARPKPQIRAGCDEGVPADPALAWIELPYNDLLEPDAREGFEELLSELDDRVERLPAPDFFGRLIEAQHLIHRWEFHHHLKAVIAGRREPHVHPMILEVLDRVAGDTQADYEAALADMHAAEDYFVRFFHDYDAVLSPSATGQAPLKENNTTGDPIFCTIWTLCGHSCLSLPWLEGADGLPVGVQLIGPSEADDRLFRTAKWLQGRLERDAPVEAE